jgi:superfamily II DNA helicase RecQ
LALTTNDIADEEIPDLAANQPALTIDPALFDKLKTWRLQRAQADGIPAYMIAHNSALETVAAKAPTTPQQLLALPGFGTRKVEAYAPDIIAIVTAHSHSG